MDDERESQTVLPLFRPEAVAARQVSPLGTLVAIRSRFGAIASACGMAFLVAIVAALLFGSYVDQVRLTGTVVADRGVVRLKAPRDAIVNQVRASEGQTVREGQILFVLSVSEEAAAGPTTQALLSNLRDRRTRLGLELEQVIAQQSAATVLADQSVAQRRDQLSALQGEMEILRERIAAATAMRDKYRRLRDQNYVTITTLEAASDRLSEQRLRLSSLGRDRSRLEEEVGQYQLQRAQLPRQLLQERNNLLRDISQTDRDIADAESRQAQVIRAPVSGIVASLDLTQGQALALHSPMASIVPVQSRMEVDLRAPTAAVGRLAEGQAVWLRFDAFPYQRYGQFRGVVRAVARTASQELEANGSAQSHFRVRVRLEDSRLPALRPDMTAAASIGVGKRRLREMLFPRHSP